MIQDGRTRQLAEALRVVEAADGSPRAAPLRAASMGEGGGDADLAYLGRDRMGLLEAGERGRCQREPGRRATTLERQNLLFQTVLDNMSQGLCFFDRSRRLIICNRRYAELYRLSMAQLRPGISQREIVELRFAAGSSPDMTPEAYVAWRDSTTSREAPTESIVPLRDGRIFSIRHQPMADGGWVATHDDITERRRAEAQIAHMARHDALTGLPNRILFRDRLEETMARARADGTMAAILCLDLDRFKEVNDTLGHALGDLLLKKTVRRIAGLVRKGDILARLGGDEFAVVMGDIGSPRHAAALAQRIVDAVAAPFDLDGHEARVGISIGIAVHTAAEDDDVDRFVRSADLALYRAKAEGRSTYRFFEPAMDQWLQARKTLERDLRQALADEQFEVHYQPQVELGSGRIIGAEALVRWHHPTRGLVLPGEFIPFAEETGLIVPIGEWILRRACAQAAAWRPMGLAVNLSPVQVRQPELFACVARILRETGLEPHRLELEITEGVLLHDTDSTLATLRRLKDLGVRIAMDDFGSGYSSLGYLRRFPFDRLKIDRNFVQDLGNSTGAGAIVQAMIGLGRSLGMQAIAEGVETQAQVDLLRLEGCTEAQGFFFGRSMPGAEFERLLETSAAGRTPGVGQQWDQKLDARPLALPVRSAAPDPSKGGSLCDPSLGACSA